jgi:hypothetical protein
VCTYTVIDLIDCRYHVIIIIISSVLLPLIREVPPPFGHNTVFFFFLLYFSVHRSSHGSGGTRVCVHLGALNTVHSSFASKSKLSNAKKKEVILSAEIKKHERVVSLSKCRTATVHVKRCFRRKRKRFAPTDAPICCSSIFVIIGN